MWTISGYRPSDKGYIYSPTQEYPTKREAVTAMMASREPKTAITRVGHAYTFQLTKAK